MTLSEKIKYIRRTFDLSQEEFAEKINVSRQVVTKWENDGGIPEISNLKLLAELFGTSIDFLLDDEKQVEHPILIEKIVMKEKNTLSNRYDYAVEYLKKNYGNKGSIYGLSEANKERSPLGKAISFLTLDIPLVTEWIDDFAIWFLVELKQCNLIIKTTKENIETRELSSIVDTNKNKIIFDKTVLLNPKKKIK